MDKANALHQQIALEQQRQQQLLQELRSILKDSLHGVDSLTNADASVSELESQVQRLHLLAQTRGYVERLKHSTGQVKQLERHARPACQAEEPTQLAKLAAAIAEQYAVCTADLQELAGATFAEQAVPAELRALEEQLRHRLQAVQASLRDALSQHIHACLQACGWPPPLTRSHAAQGRSGPLQMFTTDQAEQVNTLQQLMKALTRLQIAAERDAISAALQYNSNGDLGGVSSSSRSIMQPDPPVLWMAQELVAPLYQQLVETFGPSMQDSPGDLRQPELVLAVVERLALDNGPRIDFLQGVVQGLELHSIYQIAVEFTRALREAVKQLLRQCKLPEVAAAGDAALWMTWVDALLGFEGLLGRHGLLGVPWDSDTDNGELPPVLLRGSTLAVLAEDPGWLASWLEAEAASANRQVESVLYSPQGWEKGQQLVAEDGPAWRTESWPPRAAEEVVSLIKVLMGRLRFFPDPKVQEQFLDGAVAAVLSQAQGRIARMLQQADVFKNITGNDWLFKVCPCICFCHYLEERLSEMTDPTELLLVDLHEAEQQMALQPQQATPGSNTEQQQQQQQGNMMVNHHGGPDSNHWHHQQHTHHDQQQQQHYSGPHANGSLHDASGGAALQQQWSTQQQQLLLQSGTEALHAAEAAARTKLRVLSKPVSDFSNCRREWVLKLGKAMALGFMHHAAGYVSRGALFKARCDPLADMSAEEVVAAGVVSGELQPALSWLSRLLSALADNLDKTCFRQAWTAAAAALNRELFNSVACEAFFSNAGALQFKVDYQALVRVIAPYTMNPAAQFRELGDAVKLLNLQQQEAEHLRQVVSLPRAPNAAEMLKSVGVHYLEPELADTVLSLRLHQ